MSRSISWYARRYVERFGFHLVPVEPKRKFPRANDWGNTCITDAQDAEDYYQAKPDWNMGVALGPSSVCSLDIDCLESFSLICECFGIELDALINATPTIQGASKGMRLMFRVPAGAELPYRKLNWKREDDQAKSFTVFELRSATDGKQRLDILPPSIHPDTGLPYKWITQPAEDWPEPPRWLLAMWGDFEKFKPQMQAMCPWSIEPEAPKPRAKHLQPKGDGVIDAFLAANTLTDCLTRYGYNRIGKRWLSPHSGTGLPGVVLFPDGESCWIHHASDPLGSDDTGKPVNAFDLFSHYEHNGDIRAAVKHAADLMGMRSAPKYSEQPAAPAPTSAAGLPMPARAPVALAASAQGCNYQAPLPWMSTRNKPLKHIDNLGEICNRLGVTLRYNVIAKDEEIIIPNEGFSVDNQANASLAWLTSECSMFDFPTDKLGDFITYLSDKNPYNPVAQWIDSKPWDGVSRLAAMFATVTARDEWTDPSIGKLKDTLIKRWMISAIAAAYRPNGVSAAGVLVFQGAQYLGKTKWFKTLVPADLGLLQDGMLLRPDDKDSVKQTCSYWLVELGELDSTFRKADVAALKAFITKDNDVLRRAYARRESKFARRTVFFGSVNPREFLHDQTGNRRYWTIECEALDHSHTLDMQQVWAEVKALWDAGEGHYLLPDEMDALNKHNEGFMALDPVEERIRSGLDWDAPDATWRWAQATEILMDSGMDRPTTRDAATAAGLVRKLNGGREKTSKGKKLLLCPKKLNGY